MGILEDRIVYTENGLTRSVRGHIVEDGPDGFIKLQRRDGTIEIARSVIIKIERGR